MTACSSSEFPLCTETHTLKFAEMVYSRADTVIFFQQEQPVWWSSVAESSVKQRDTELMGMWIVSTAQRVLGCWNYQSLLPGSPKGGWTCTIFLTIQVSSAL